MDFAFHGLFSVRVGLIDGENQIENKMGFVTVVVVGNGDGRIVAENRHSVGEFVPINVVETGLNEATSGFDVGDFDDGASLRCNRKADGNEDLLDFLGGDQLVLIHDGMRLGGNGRAV